MTYGKPYIILFLFLITIIPAFSAEKTLDKKEWKKIVKDKNYAEKEEEKPEEETEETETKERKDFDLPEINFPKELLFAIILIVIIVLIVFVISQYKRNASINTEKIEVTTIEEAENNLPLSDLERLLQKLLKEKDYRSAVRVIFLRAIQLLSEQQHITWKREKTNWTYYYEISDKTRQDRFRPLIAEFELIWYGDRDIRKENYEHYLQLYNQFKQTLNES